MAGGAQLLLERGSKWGSSFVYIHTTYAGIFLGLFWSWISAPSQTKNEQNLPKVLNVWWIFHENQSYRCLHSHSCAIIKVNVITTTLIFSIIWASTRENLSSVVCEQQRRRPTCASAQTDQRLCYSLFGKYHISTCYRQIFNLLASLIKLDRLVWIHFVGNPEDRFSCAKAHFKSDNLVPVISDWIYFSQHWWLKRYFPKFNRLLARLQKGYVWVEI